MYSSLVTNKEPTKKRKRLTTIFEDEPIVEVEAESVMGSESSLATTKTESSLTRYNSLLNCGSLSSLPMTPMGGSRTSIDRSCSSLNHLTINQNLVMKIVKIQLVGYPAKKKAANGDIVAKDVIPTDRLWVKTIQEKK